MLKSFHDGPASDYDEMTRNGILDGMIRFHRMLFCLKECTATFQLLSKYPSDLKFSYGVSSFRCNSSKGFSYVEAALRVVVVDFHVDMYASAPWQS